MKFKIRILFVVTAFLVVTFSVFGPISLYLTNITEFWLDTQDILLVTITCSIALMVLLSGIGILLNERLLEYYICIIFGSALGLYIQGNYVTTNYGLLNGDSINWGAYSDVAVWDTILWIVCLAVPFFIRLWAKKWKSILSGISLGILVVQLITVGILGLAANNDTEQIIDKEYSLTNRGMLELSSNENILVFILDRYDSKVFSELINEYGDLKQGVWEDFTYYPDTVTGGNPTNLALPYILTGQPYTGGRSYPDYLETSFKEAPLYTALKEANYNIGIYTNSQFVSPAVKDWFLNASDSTKRVSSYPKLAYYIYRLTAFRYFPHVLKKNVWMYSGDFDAAADNSGDDSSTYLIDDALFYNKLVDEGIQVQGRENTFRLYHMNGAHPNYTLTRDSKRSPEETSLVEQELGVMNILKTYFDQMKALGIYDNANIIVLADHGDYGVGQNPVFLVKHGTATQTFTVSEKPVSYANLHPTILSFVGKNNTGIDDIFSLSEDDNQERYCYAEEHEGAKCYAREYVVKGHVYDEGTINPTGARYEIYTVGQKSIYTLGTRLYFDMRATGYQYAISGLSGVQTDHTWSEGKETEWVFPLEKSPEDDLFVEFLLHSRMTAVQRVGVYVGEHFLGYYKVTQNNLAFTIPKELVRTEQLEFRFVYLDAVSPSKISKTGTDDRILSLMFESMEIRKKKETDVDTEKITEKYVLNNKIVFTEEDDGRRYFSYGLSGIETDFSWSLGTSGHMVLFVDDNLGDLTAEFCFKSIHAPPQRFIVRCGENVLYEASVTSTEEPVTFTIPAKCVENGYLELDFEYPDAVSPQSIGENEDTRVLAFMFYSICFYEGK